MRAHRRTITLDKGLQPEENMPLNGAWLSKALGVRKGVVSLELEPNIINPTTLTAAWPFPQIINLQKEIIIIQADGLYLVEPDWTLSLLQLVDSTNGSCWQFVDYGLYWIATNGLRTFDRHIGTNTIIEVDYELIPQMGSFTDFRGQIVGCYDEFAVWSGIGSTSFEIDWKNEAGHRNMTIGVIYKCNTLNDQMVVFYGADGISALMPAGQTFGFQHLGNHSLFGEHTVGFGKQEHIFISSEGFLHKLTGEGIGLLGYKKYMQNLDADATRILYNKQKNDYYITDGNICYLYANDHLTQVNKVPVSLDVIDGVLVGFWTGTTNNIEITLQEQDMNLVSMKTVTFCELGIQTNGRVMMSLGFKYELGQVMKSIGWLPVNDSGYCYMTATANIFAPMVFVHDPSEFHLAYITYAVKLTDNRIQNQLQSIMDGSWNVN